MPAILAASATPVPSATVTCFPSIVSVTCLLIRHYRFIKILSVTFNARDHGHRGKFTQRAQTFALDLFSNNQQQINIGFGTVTRMNALSDIRHPICTVTTGRTLAAGLMIEEMDGLVDEPIQRDGFINDDHRS